MIGKRNMLLPLFIFAAVKASRVFFTDIGVTALIETSPTYCKVHSDRNTIKFIIKLHPDVIYVNDTTLHNYKKMCEASENDPKNGTFTYPGTLWCGPGFIARTYDDLGLHYEEDICCREHDHCKNFIAAGSCKENICNHSPFTRSHCDCDRKFRKCLQDTNTNTANTIGAIFFNILKLICFEANPNCQQIMETNNSRNDSCQTFRFVNAGRYSATERARFRIFGKKEYLLNILFRKIGLL